MIIRPTGYRPDPPKLKADRPDHDAIVRIGGGPVPELSKNTDLIVSVIDQLGLSSCVANAVAQAVRASHVLHGSIRPELLSRLALYWLARAYHHETNIDAGTYIRMAFSALVKYGFCPESVYPYTDQNKQWSKIPPSVVFQASYDQRPASYHRIFETGQDRVDAVKRALAKRYLVVFGTDVSDKFCAGDIGNGIVGPPVGLSIAGGHALTIVDHEKDVFNIVNSWSENWGDKGFVKFTADYIAWANSNDFWICEAAPTFSVKGIL